MLDTIWGFLRFLLPVLPIVLAALLPMKLNLKKEKRHLQLVIPIIALVYGIVYLVFIDDIAQLLLTGIYWVLEKLEWLIDKFPFLDFINNINWAYSIMYIANAAMLVLFLIIKTVLLPPLSLAKPENGKLMKSVTSIFYKYDEDDKKWYIKNEFAHAKKVMKYVHIGVLIFSSLLFAATCYLISKNTLSVPFYPMFGILVFGECYFFLCGIPKGGENVEEIEEIPEEAEEEIDYSTLKEKYEKTFGDRLSGSVDLPPISDKRSSVDQLLERYLEEADANDSQEAKLFYNYFRQLSNSGADLDDGLIASARKIIDGKNVLFNTPFYEDTTQYIFLPITRHLMQNKKILIIVGRTGADKSIMEWLRKGLFGVNNFENLWKINYLSAGDHETQIAILPMKDIYNQKMLAMNAKFLEETTMTIIMDPTRLLGTMQVGLSNVVSYLRRGTAPQYIAYDRNCDGLVDSLSHVLGSSIEEVTATVVGSAKTTSMIWEADGQNLHHRLGLDTARYLGVGTELGAMAVANKVSAVNWFAYEKFPATDIKWIVSQYYGPLCKVMNVPVSQSEFEKRIGVSADLWSMPKAESRFIVAEDEYNNPYEIIRQFSSRASKQAFIHVLSQNYLLRDYMCENAEIFTYDPKAIPSLVADYQRVRNNTVYKITMRLINGEIYEEEIKNSLELIGINSDDVHKDLIALITECFIPNGTNEKMTADGVINIRHELVIDPKTRRPERKRVYSITNNVFIEKFLSQLQVVHYVAEDELDKNLYMNSILYGHIYQKYLPGTFTVFDGKYYEVVSITRSSGMVVRRAADHITRRSYYRQLRTYNVEGFKTVNDVAAVTSYGNVQFERGEAKICVSTEGYLEQSDYGNIKTANRVTLQGIPERVYPHKNIIRFKLKGADAKVRFTIATMMNELFITLFPEMHEYIVATTFGEAPEQYEGYVPNLLVNNNGNTEDDGYIYVIEDSLIDMGLLINVDRYFKRIMEIITDLLCWHNEQVAPPESGIEDGDEPEGPDAGDDEGSKKPGCIGAIKDKFKRKKKGGSGEETAEGEEPQNGEDTSAEGEEPSEEEPKKRGWWSRFKDKFKKKKKDNSEEPTEEPTEESESEDGTPAEDAPQNGEGSADSEGPAAIEDPFAGDNSSETENPVEEEPEKRGWWSRFKDKFKKNKEESDDTSDDTSNDIPNDVPNDTPNEGDNKPNASMYTSFSFTHKEFSIIDDNEEEITGEDEESVDIDSGDAGILGTPERKPYAERFYMLYGFETVPEVFDLSGTWEYLKDNGFADNYLKQTRDNAKNTKLKWYNHRFEPGEHYCDFCGTKLEGTISVLKDGRERCSECKSTAITKVREFRKLYKHAHTRMEDVFGIKINTKISIRITNAEEIAKEGGYEFKPTPGFDGRALGFAQRLGNGKTRIVLENGAPRLETEKTLVHELTHVWQYENMDCLWNPRDLVAIEGMAVWTEAQYLVCNELEERADAYVRMRCSEASEYGQGMREYIRKYPLRKGKNCRRNTPFSHPGKHPLN